MMMALVLEMVPLGKPGVGDSMCRSNCSNKFDALGDIVYLEGVVSEVLILIDQIGREGFNSLKIGIW